MPQFRAAYPGSCGLALEVHEQTFGPAPEGTEYECVEVVDGFGHVGALVYVPDMAGTYRVVVRYEISGAGGSNMALTTHDWRWSPSEPPLGTDFEIIEDRLDDFFGAASAVNGIISNVAQVTGYTWAMLNPDGSGQQGEQVRAVGRALSFTGTGMMPPQVACSVTEVTDVRRRWGRFYLPFISPGVVDSYGRMEDTSVDGLALAAGLLHGQQNVNWQSVVYGAADPSSLEVRETRVDDVLDVIRSRRWQDTLHRAMYDQTDPPTP